MNAVYVFLIFSFASYVYGAPKANVEHDCDPLAMNTSKDTTNRTGPDSTNQTFPIKAFLQYQKTNYYVARATPNIEPTSTSSSAFCHVPFYNRNCGPLHHYQEFPQSYDPDREKGLDGIKFHISFVGMNLDDGKAIFYEMDVIGTNEDDYIFKWDDETGAPIKAYEIDDQGQRIPIQNIPQQVLDSLKSEFAIHEIGLGPVPPPPPTPTSSKQDQPEEDEPEEEDFFGDGFEDQAGPSNRQNQIENYEARERLYAIYVTCDGRSIWVSYNKPVVDRNDEAEESYQIDKVVHQLRSTIVELNIQENKPNVKPVSTYMPARFDALVPKAELPVRPVPQLQAVQG